MKMKIAALVFVGAIAGCTPPVPTTKFEKIGVMTLPVKVLEKEVTHRVKIVFETDDGKKINFRRNSCPGHQKFTVNKSADIFVTAYKVLDIKSGNSRNMYAPLDIC